MRTETVGQALDADLDDAAQGVAGLLAAIDQFGDLVVTIGIERVHDAAVAACALFFQRARLGRNGELADLDDVGEGRDPQRPKELLGQGPGGHAGGGFPGAGPFEDRPNRGQVLDRAAQVAMARPGPGEVFHIVDLEVLVGDEQGDGAAQGYAPPDAGEDFHMIGFDFLPAAATIAALAPHELGIDGLDIQIDSCREAVHEGQQGPAVRFTGGKVS